MSSDDEDYEEEKFQCSHIITEDHKQTIYGISICQQTLPDESEDAFLFATCARNQICIYKYTVIDKKSSVQLIQSYSDSDDTEYFYDCKWTMFGNKTILAAGGLRGVVRIIDIAQQCYLKPLRHLSNVYQIAFAGGQPTLMASSCSNYTVLLWDAKAALCLANYVGPEQHKQGVLTVDISYDGTFIVSGGMDNIVCVWSTQETEIAENMAIAKSGPLFREFRLSAPHRVHFPVFHSSTMHEHYVDSVKCLNENIIISKSADHVYCIWKFNEGQKEPEILFRWNRSEKSDIVFDVRLGISVARKLMAIGRLDGSIFVWNMTTLPTHKTNDENMQPYGEKSYELPLFATHYITIRVHSNDLRGKQYDNNDVVGFKFQVKSTNPSVVDFQKKVMIPKQSNISNTIILEDLYILPRKNALGHIFNAYPTPTLIDVNKNLINNSTIDTTWSIEGVTMDITNLTFHLDVFYNDDSVSSHIRPFIILVIQPKRIVDTIFYISLPFLIVSISILMGILLDLRIMGDIIKHPTPLIVGFVAQYGLMPFLAMGIAKLFHYTPLNSLALFVIGCCPGSGASNQWTVIFDGDVNLSAVMSFVSTATSFIMMPIYFYTLGKLYMDELSITVPFLGLARSLGLVVIPYSIGIAICYCVPKSRAVVQKLIKPMMICLMLFFLTFGLAVNWYLFRMIDLYTTLTAPLLPFLGFLFGALLAWMSRLSWQHIKTIGIEAGIQNVGIAFMIILYSFPQPYATQALIVPMVVGFLTNKPFWIIFLVREQIRKYKKRKELEKQTNMDGKLIASYDKTVLNNGVNDTREETVENMQKL